MDFALKSRLPSVCEDRSYAASGGLLSYAPSFFEMLRHAATYVDKILKGAKPGDLAVEQSAKIDLVINRKTARTFGLTIPRELLLGADLVIEQRVRERLILAFQQVHERPVH